MIGRIVIAGLLAVVVAVPARAVESGHSVNKRMRRQNHRINEGLHNGKLSPKEADRLRNQEGALKDEEHAMREANGGKLSKGDRRVLQNQENRLSHRIHRQKHDGNNR